MTISGGMDKLKGNVAREIFQVVHEAAANAARHAQASHIAIVLDLSRDDVTGVISDDGIGMSADLVQNGRPGHWGITGMRERIANLGGELTVETQEGGGTAIRFTIAAAAAYG